MFLVEANKAYKSNTKKHCDPKGDSASSELRTKVGDYFFAGAAFLSFKRKSAPFSWSSW